MDNIYSHPTDVAAAARPTRSLPKRICLVTGEFAGPDFNGGIGTTNRALALFLRSQGYRVDILYTRVSNGEPFSARGSFDDHVAFFAELGIGLFAISNDGEWNDWQTKSYEALRHLIAHQYDLALFDDTHGTAYYPLLARRTGNRRLRHTVMAVTTHSATEWIDELNETPITTPEEVRVIEMERRSVELADALKAPSAYILKKYAEYGWQLPEKRIVLANLIGARKSFEHKNDPMSVRELVFFGRLETRKGLWMFCRVLDLLKWELAGRSVTFLGKSTFEGGTETASQVLRTAAAWPFPVRLITDFNSEQAVSYLQTEGRLAVIASPEDNSPSVILECVDGGIPFIACRGSGGEELIDPGSREANLCEPSVHGLRDKMLDALGNGGRRARRAFSQDEVRERTEVWISALVHDLKPVADDDDSEAEAEDSGARAHRAPPILMVVIPRQYDRAAVAAELSRTVRDYQQHIEIEALVEDTVLVKAALRSVGDLPQIHVSSASDFATVARSLKYRLDTIVGICHISQILPPQWINRARDCFAQSAEIFAVTGMIGVEPSEHRRRKTRQTPDTQEEGAVIRRHLLGRATALLAQASETNSGFTVARSQDLAELADVDPVDRGYGRLKMMEDWIEELLLKGLERGKEFELIPDLLMATPVSEPIFEVNRRAPLIRSLAQSMWKYPHGSDRALLGRLAIDSGLLHERGRRNADYVDALTLRTNKAVRTDADIYGRQHKADLATLAHATGHIELALDLSASLVGKTEESAGASVSALLSAAIESVSLFEEATHSRYRRFNLEDNWSLQLLPDKKQIRLHPNAANKGMAAVMFSSIDTSKVTHFSSELAVPAVQARPIRFRVEFIAQEKQHHWSQDKVIVGGGGAMWRFKLPNELRGSCRVLLGVEMANPDDTSEHGFAIFGDPRLVHETDDVSDS